MITYSSNPKIFYYYLTDSQLICMIERTGKRLNKEKN